MTAKMTGKREKSWFLFYFHTLLFFDISVKKTFIGTLDVVVGVGDGSGLLVYQDSIDHNF